MSLPIPNTICFPIHRMDFMAKEAIAAVTKINEQGAVRENDFPVSLLVDMKDLFETVLAEQASPRRDLTRRITNACLLQAEIVFFTESRIQTVGRIWQFLLSTQNPRSLDLGDKVLAPTVIKFLQALKSLACREAESVRQQNILAAEP